MYGGGRESERGKGFDSVSKGVIRMMDHGIKAGEVEEREQEGE